ncbi:hypothetical protein ABZ851_36420 [Streptomyces sp. NPDC047049]|uniref:hypothetical protein n=1 Tax=Streptomyces sp. NPDC047049 TaxID=3156688 RepID=UPI0033CF2F8F
MGILVLAFGAGPVWLGTMLIVVGVLLGHIVEPPLAGRARYERSRLTAAGMPWPAVTG